MSGKRCIDVISEALNFCIVLMDNGLYTTIRIGYHMPMCKAMICLFLHYDSLYDWSAVVFKLGWRDYLVYERQE